MCLLFPMLMCGTVFILTLACETDGLCCDSNDSFGPMGAGCTSVRRREVVVWERGWERVRDSRGGRLMVASCRRSSERRKCVVMCSLGKGNGYTIIHVVIIVLASILRDTTYMYYTYMYMYISYMYIATCNCDIDM